MDGTFYGPGLFRSNCSDLISLGNQGVASFPTLKLPIGPTSVRFFAPTLGEANTFPIKQSLIDNGIALLSVSSPLGSKDALGSFLVDGLDAIPRTHSDTQGDVWDVRPLANWTAKDARSHTSLAFEVHTDASFEMMPPRFVAMSVIRADNLGGGRLSVVRIWDIVEELDKDTKTALQTLCPKWIVPNEFKKTGASDVFAPVLMSDSRARFRRDKLGTEHMSEEEGFPGGI